MSTARASLGSIFTVIGTTASTAVGIIDDLNKVATMGSNRLDFMLAEQKLRLRDELLSLNDVLEDEYCRATTERDINALKFISKSDEHQRLYANAMKHYRAAIAE
jgi:hypothetical protein